MSNIRLLDVEDLVANRFSDLDSVLNIIPDSSRSVFFDDKNVAVYPYDPELKKLIKEDMFSEIPMASGQQMKSQTDTTRYSGEGFTRIDKPKMANTIFYGGLGLVLLRTIFR